MRRSAALLAASLAALLAACAPLGGGSPDGGPADGPPDDGGAPRVSFRVDDRPHDPSDGYEEAARARYSDPIRVVVEHLPPSVRARVEAESAGGASYAVFDVAADGTLDTGRDAPVEGTYEGVDEDGLLWSMEGEQDGPLDLALHVRVIVDGDVVATGSLARDFIDEGVHVVSVAEGTRVGVLAIPDGDGPFPAVLVFGGSEGGTLYGEFMAPWLAQQGYAAFGVAYFGAPGLPTSLSEVPLQILEDDLAFLAAHEAVDPSRVAVMGVSRGGELALLLGARFPDAVSAVVAEVPSGVVWGGLGFQAGSAWSDDGAPVPYVPSAGADPEVHVDGDGFQHVSLRPTFLASLDAADEQTLEAATIPVERASGPILMLAGDDDQLWPSCVLAGIALARLVEHGHRDAHGDELHCFPDAGHLLGVPGGSTTGLREYFHAGFDAWLVMGGTPQGTARAQRQGDTIRRAFLERALAP